VVVLRNGVESKTQHAMRLMRVRVMGFDDELRLVVGGMAGVGYMLSVSYS